MNQNCLPGCQEVGAGMILTLPGAAEARAWPFRNMPKQPRSHRDLTSLGPGSRFLGPLTFTGRRPMPSPRPHRHVVLTPGAGRAGWRQAPRTPQFYLSQGTERCLVASIQWRGLETDCLGPLPAHHQSWAPRTVRTSVCKSRASQGRGHSGVGGGISARGHELSVLSANNNDDDDRSTDTSA